MEEATERGSEVQKVQQDKTLQKEHVDGDKCGKDVEEIRNQHQSGSIERKARSGRLGFTQTVRQNFETGRGNSEMWLHSKLNTKPVPMPPVRHFKWPEELERRSNHRTHQQAGNELERRVHCRVQETEQEDETSDNFSTSQESVISRDT